MAAANILNRGEIIAQGLELGGNPDIATVAGIFLNVFLDHLARNFDWDELLTEATVSSGSNVEELDLSSVTDYRAIRKVHVTDQLHPLTQVDFVDMWAAITAAKSQNNTGDPQFFATDPAGAKLFLFPVPSAGVTAKMLYYRQPPEITVDGTVPFYKDAAALVAAVADFAATYDRDPFAQVLSRQLGLASAQQRINGFDTGRATAQELSFEPSVFRTPPDIDHRFRD